MEGENICSPSVCLSLHIGLFTKPPSAPSPCRQPPLLCRSSTLMTSSQLLSTDLHSELTPTCLDCLVCTAQPLCAVGSLCLSLQWGSPALTLLYHPLCRCSQCRCFLVCYENRSTVSRLCGTWRDVPPLLWYNAFSLSLP